MMSATFSKTIHTEKGSKFFDFIFAAGTEGIGYVVNVENDFGKNVQFLMRKGTGKRWMIVSLNPPLWILNVELELSDIIEENL